VENTALFFYRRRGRYGFQIRPLHALGMVVAITETLLWIRLEFDIRGGAVLCGPLSIVLRLTNFISLAAISFLLGALLSRFGWIAAGRVSGRDPEAVFASQE
jgi:hypothetical protein